MARRKFYANMESGHTRNSLSDKLCACGGRICESARYIPALYIVEPPYKRPNPNTTGRYELLGRWCGSCDSYEKLEKA